MPMFVGQSDARMQWMQGQQQQDLENRRILHDQRMRDRAMQDQEQARRQELASRENMQREQIAASQASQRFAADRASSDAYNARNDAYSTATDPRLQAIERQRLNEALGRDQALIGTHSNARINEHFEGMQDDRARQLALANNQAQLEALHTMQKGNIDSRLLSQQGQQGMRKAEFDDQTRFATDMRQRDMAIEERNAQLSQTHRFSEDDAKYLAKNAEDIQNLQEAYESGKVSTDQFRSTMATLLGRKAGRVPSERIVTVQQQFEQQAVKLPDGRIATPNGKNGWTFSMPVSQSQGQGADPAVAKHKQQMDIANLVAKRMAMTKGAEGGPVYEQTPAGEAKARRDVLRSMGQDVTEPPTDVRAIPDEPQDTISRWRRTLDQMENSAAQDAPVPRLQPRPVMPPDGPASQLPEEYRDPFRPHPTSPRPPFVGQNQRTEAAGADPAAADAQAAGAMQVFKALIQKNGGMPPSGSEEEKQVMAAAAYLKQRGIDPTGGARRKTPVEDGQQGHMNRYGAWNK